MTDNVIRFGGADFNEIKDYAEEGLFSLLDAPVAPDLSQVVTKSNWFELDDVFKIYPGQFVVVTGIPGHGKSTFLFNYIQQLAREHGTASFLYVPENERFLKQTLRRIWPGNDASFRHYAEYQCFFQSAIVGEWQEAPKDLIWVLSRAAIAIEVGRCDIVVIDPWNELEYSKPPNMLMTDYIRVALMYLKQFARKYQVTVFVVAHPTKAVTEHGGRIPTLYDIDGSANWANKCDNGLVVTRDTKTSSAKVISAKVREVGAGRLGNCHFQVNPDTGRFTPMRGASYGEDEIT